MIHQRRVWGVTVSCAVLVSLTGVAQASAAQGNGEPAPHVPSASREHGLTKVSELADRAGVGDPTAVPELSHHESLQAIVPDVIGETRDTGTVSVGQAEDGSVSVEVDRQQGDPADSSTSASFTVDYATAVLGAEDGIAALGAEEAGVTAHVQPTGSGVRVLTVISAASAPESYAYTFDVPETTQLADHGDTYYLVDDSGVYGAIMKPWATDADGDPVPTRYTWDEGTLTQHVDLDAPGVDLPVIADPAWTYTYYYTITKTAPQVKSMLTNCFNCYFPVAGAPRGYPAYNQLLPLTVGPLNFECRFAGELYRPSDRAWYGFKFNATSNHVDGAGSYISFVFDASSTRRYLMVTALIQNDSVWINNAFYRSGAIQNWQKFANNIG